MSLSRILLSALGVCASFLLATWDSGSKAHAQAKASNARSASVGNPITGEGLPNPVLREVIRRVPGAGTWRPRRVASHAFMNDVEDLPVQEREL